MRLYATFIFALVLAMLTVSGIGRAADTQPTEYQLKAAYIYHFAQFVDWPSDAFTRPDSPLIIGVLGKNPFGNDLQRTVQGKALGGHPLVVQEFDSMSAMTNTCHILFISSSEKKRYEQIITDLDGAYTLTVSEGDPNQFIEAGGMIQFVMDGDRIRFEINKTKAEKSRLGMSFKLLSLAQEVR